MPSWCTVCTRNGNKDKGISFFRYPKNHDRRREWFKAVDRKDLITRVGGDFRICEVHFERKFIIFSKYNKKKYLSVDAFPSLNISANDCANTDTSENENLSATIAEVQNVELIDICDQRSPVHTKHKDPLIITCDQTRNDCHTEQAILIEEETSSWAEIDVFDPLEKNIENESGPTQAASHLTGNTPRKRKLYSQLKEAKNAKTIDLNNVEQEDFLKLSEKFMNNGMAQLIKWQVDLNAGLSGNQYSVPFKFFALNLHYSGPIAYRFLQNTLCLPALPVLQKFVKPIGTKTDVRLLNALRIKVSKMSPQEKISSICVGCMSLNANLHYDSTNDRIVGFHEMNGTQTPEAAKHVMVIMVRGIMYKWKQPVAHSFLANCKNYAEVNAWIDEVISALIDIGLDIRVFVTDQDPDLVSAAKARNISANKTYFEVKGHKNKIYYVFDVPHLTKCIRNNLQTYYFVYDKKVAKFSDIMDLYEHDQKNSHKLAPKLTQLHLCPNNFENMGLKLTVQVLSNTVAAALKTYVDLRQIDVTALDTVDFIMKINNLFDILNSNTVQSCAKFKQAICGDDFQIDFLQEMLHLFKQLKLVKIDSGINVTNTMNFIEGFQVTINSVLQLSMDLKSQAIYKSYLGYKEFIFTRHLNQESLEIFFGKVRRAVGNCQEPTCQQVSKEFEFFFISNILKTPKGTNCEEDFNSLLMKVDDSNIFYKDSLEMLSNAPNGTLLDVDTNDYNVDLPMENALVYVAGYLYKKCLNQHQYTKTSENAVNMSRHPIYCHYKDNIESNLQSSFSNFKGFIELLEQKFRTFFNSHHKITNVGQEILKYINDCTFEMPCPCFPIDYLKKLYVRLRINHTIKENNQLLKTQQNSNKKIMVGNL